jgi:hypothetical protein
MQPSLMLGKRIIKKIVMSFSIVVVKALSKWTDSNMDVIQGMCLIALLFITAIQLNRRAVQPRLLRLICLLYCNQQVRRLFSGETNEANSFFPNLLLAVALAVLLIIVTNNKDQGSVDDMRTMLEALLYMYGDILDFLFKYGVLTLTLSAFGVGFLIQTIKPPENQIQAFFLRMAGIISANVLYQGVTSLINSTAHMELIESIAAASVLRLLIPSMESYLTYLTAAQLTSIVPDVSPIMLCIIVWNELIPLASRGWITELCATYIILSVINFLISIPTWGASVVLIMAHYVDYILVHLD